VGDFLTRESLRGLFNSQLGVLIGRGCPRDIIDAFRELKEQIIAEAMENKTLPKHSPFILVVPVTASTDLNYLMSMVRHRYHKGENEINKHEVADLILVPAEPYAMFNVGDGGEILGSSPERTRDAMRRQNWSCLTAPETIALCTHTDVLHKYSVSCAESVRHPSLTTEHQVPHISIIGGTPTLRWRFAVAGAGYRETSPYCQFRI
jgi:hypothetical protein